jgi:CelD/BcsL family acetyltransferase involved in cellulose biosynthesis
VALSIQHESEASTEEWQRVWNACEHATFFQAPEWAQVWEEHTNGTVRPEPKLLRFSDGQEAILPLCFQPKLRGLLNRYVSSPEATYGGWISAAPLTTAHAVLLTRWLLQAGGKNLVWRLNPYDPMALEAAMICHVDGRKDVTHSVRLDADAQELFKGFKKGCREDIRKAQKCGHIDVSPATTVEEWRAYYRVYQDSLQRWGHGPNDGYAWELFDTLRRRSSSNIRLWVARYDGLIVSGELSFYSRRHAVSWHAATLKDYLRSGVGKYQTYEILKDACARGFHWLDFNPSAGLDGVKELKESFRAEVLPAPLVYVDTKLKSVIRKCAVTFNVRDAKICVEPLDALIAGAAAQGRIIAGDHVAAVNAAASSNGTGAAATSGDSSKGAPPPSATAQA